MRLSRSGFALVAAALLGGAVSWPGVGDSVRTVAGPDFPAALLGVAELGLALGSAWLLLVAAAGLAHVRLPGVPRVVAAALFVAIGAGAPAHADQRHDLTGLPLPDRPTITTLVPSADTTSPTAVTVRTGDTLWAIAADHLGSGASVADVAAATHRWFHANRAVIGSDPDLILPGQVLHPPGEDDS